MLFSLTHDDETWFITTGPPEGFRNKDSSISTESFTLLLLFLSCCLYWEHLAVLQDFGVRGGSLILSVNFSFPCRPRLHQFSHDLKSSALGCFGLVFPTPRSCCIAQVGLPLNPPTSASQVLSYRRVPWCTSFLKSRWLWVAMWVLEIKPSPQKEQHVLLITVPSIQHLPVRFYLHICLILNWTLADPTALKASGVCLNACIY